MMSSRERSRWAALRAFALKIIVGCSQVKLCPAHEESRITESKEKTVFLTLAACSEVHVENKLAQKEANIL